MGDEAVFGRRVRAALKGCGCRCYPIETGSTAVGVPDLLVVHKGGVALVELKSRRGMMMAMLSDSRQDGPGQLSFALGVARVTSFRAGGVIVSRHSFTLVECMDGVGLIVSDAKGSYLAACWEGFPSGGDLTDALRAWGVSVMPSVEMADESVMACYRACADAYSRVTGIVPSLEGVKDGDVPLGEAGGSGRAYGIARDLCDRGRLMLLMERVKAGARDARVMPVEDGGHVIVSAEEA